MSNAHGQSTPESLAGPPDDPRFRWFHLVLSMYGAWLRGDPRGFKMPPGRVRQWGGHAKRHATFTLRDHGWKGKLWAVRGKATPVRDRNHQLNVYYYILAHAEQGAWVWKWERPKEVEKEQRK